MPGSSKRRGPRARHQAVGVLLWCLGLAGGQPFETEEQQITRQVAWAASHGWHAPQGPFGDAAAHVFTFADTLTVTLCHLARSVEAAGAWLHVLGLRDGSRSDLPGRDERATDNSSSAEEVPLHFEDKFVLLKKHVFLARAIRQLPPNATVVFVDGFDVLFQRPLAELVAEYRRLAGPVAAQANGKWPVLFGGERNCWPFPHGSRLHVRGDGDGERGPRTHEFAPDVDLSGGHHGTWSYAYGDQSPWSIKGEAVCGEWLSRRSDKSTDAMFPFLCTGTLVGTASALRRLLRRLFLLYRTTQEYYDQALLTILLLQNQSLGLVDVAGTVFFNLHGHDEERDLERPLCYDGYLARQPQAWRDHRPPQLPVVGHRLARPLQDFMPPKLRHAASARVAANTPPAVLHFNGNGKRHMMRCIEAFRSYGLLGGRDEDSAECTFYDVDRKAWQRLA